MCPDDVISRTGECNVNCINSSYLMLNENRIGEPAVIAEDFVWTNATLLIRSPCSLMARASHQGWGCRGCESYLEFWSWQATIITKKFYGLVKCKETNPLIPITEAFCEPHRFFWKKEKRKEHWLDSSFADRNLNLILQPMWGHRKWVTDTSSVVCQISSDRTVFTSGVASSVLLKGLAAFREISEG